MKHLLFVTSFLFLLACNPAPNTPDTPTEKPAPAELTTIILVRHAEKESGDDPGLTEAGQTRADKLAQLLQQQPLAAIYSSPYRRTEATAAPTASQQGITITSYDPKALPDFARQLLDQHVGETVLVVGHSNSTPKLTGLLDQTEAYPSFSEDDYGNLFVLTIGDSKSRLLKLTY